jgi:ABC-type multidrug transport system ATPase subunit
MEPVIVAEKLSKRFGQIEAVKGVDLEVQPGEVFGLLGPNGSGKTTLIRLLCGLLQPTSGRGIVGGFDITRDPERVKRTIGYVSQKFSLYPDLTVEENIDFFADVYGIDALDASRSKRDLLKLCGLEGRERQQAGRLSGGFKQRLALACALIHRPKIVFLDEPTAGVDPVARRMMWDLLFQLAEGGTTLFVTTHYMDEAERCTHAAYLYFGTLLVNGDPNSMKKEEIALTNRRIEIVCQPLMTALSILRNAPHVDDVSVFGQALHIRLKDLPPESPATDPYASFAASARRARVMDVLRKRLTDAGLDVMSVRSAYPTLEDIFVTMTRKEDDKAGPVE